MKFVDKDGKAGVIARAVSHDVINALSAQDEKGWRDGQYLIDYDIPTMRTIITLSIHCTCCDQLLVVRQTMEDDDGDNYSTQQHVMFLSRRIASAIKSHRKTCVPPKSEYKFFQQPIERVYPKPSEKVVDDGNKYPEW